MRNKISGLVVLSEHHDSKQNTYYTTMNSSLLFSVACEIGEMEINRDIYNPTMLFLNYVAVFFNFDDSSPKLVCHFEKQQFNIQIVHNSSIKLLSDYLLSKSKENLSNDEVAAFAKVQIEEVFKTDQLNILDKIKLLK